MAERETLKGTLKPDGTVVLDRKPNVPAGRVQVILQPQPEVPAGAGQKELGYAVVNPQSRDETSGVGAFFGTWIGDETDEDILKAVRAMK